MNVTLKNPMSAIFGSFESVVENLADGLIFADREGNILHFNPAALSMHGFKDSSEIFSQLSDYPKYFRIRDLSGEVIPLENWPLARGLRLEKLISHEVEVLRTDTGFFRYLSYSAYPILDETGELRMVVLNVKDTTEQRKTLQTLELSEERLRLATHTAKTGLWELDLNTMAAWRNESHDQIFGHKELLPEWSFEIFLTYVHPLDRKRVADLMTRAMETNDAFEFECRIIWRNGTQRWMAVNGGVVLDEKGLSTKRMIGTNLDISDRKSSEEKIRIEKDKFEAIFINSPASLALLMGPDLIFEKVNFNFLTVDTGRKLKGKPLTEALPEIMNQPIIEHIKDVYRTGEAFEAKEMILKNIPSKEESSEDKYFDISIIRVQSGEGLPYGVYFHANDVTQKVLDREILRIQNQTMELTLTEAPLNEVLAGLLQMIQSSLGVGAVGSVLLLDSQKKHLNLAAAPDLPDDYNKAIEGLAIGPEVGSCGTAAYHNKTVIVSDISTDPLWKDFKDLALNYGLKSCWSTPIRSSLGEVLGTFALYFNCIKSPTLHNQRLIDLAIYTAGIIIERQREVEKRLEAEIALRASESRLNLALASSKIGFWDWNAITGETYLSDTLMEDWQINRETFKNTLDECLVLIHPEDRDWVNAEIMKASQLLTPYNVEYRVIRPSGEIIWVNAKGRMYLDQKGNPERLSGITINMTERRLMEEELRRTQFEAENAQQILHNVFMQTSAAIAFWKGPELVYELVNEPYLELIDRKGSDVVGKRLREVLPEVDNQLIEMVENIFKTGEPLIMNEVGVSLYRNHKLDLCYFNYSISPIKNLAGEVERLVVIAFEVTDQVKSRHLLEQSETRFRELADSMPVVVWTAKADGKIDYLNRRWYEISGMGDHVDLDQAWTSSIHPEDYKSLQEVWNEGHTSGHHFEVEYRIFHPLLNSYRWYLGRGVPILNKEGRITKWYGTITDIHDLRELQEELKISIQTRDEFLSIASHELKTPLTSLKLQAQLHQRAAERNDGSVYEPQKVDKFVKQTEKQLNRLNRLVDDMLDVSRIRSGKLSIDKERINLCEVVSDVIQRMNAQFGSGNYPLPELEAPEAVFLDWDKYRMEQVVSNLLTNAIRYGNKNPIKVAITPKKKSYQLVVEDKGIGIDEKSKEIIFNRFERAVNANEVSGLGLGLFITKQIVSAHDGKIWVESKLGEGSRFIIEFPT